MVSKYAKSGGPCRGRTYGPLISRRVVSRGMVDLASRIVEVRVTGLAEQMRSPKCH